MKGFPQDPMHNGYACIPDPANLEPDDRGYDEWLDTLDHHTVGECECERCERGEDVAA